MIEFPAIKGFNKKGVVFEILRFFAKNRVRMMTVLCFAKSLMVVLLVTFVFIKIKILIWNFVFIKRLADGEIITDKRIDRNFEVRYMLQ